MYIEIGVVLSIEVCMYNGNIEKKKEQFPQDPLTDRQCQ